MPDKKKACMGIDPGKSGAACLLFEDDSPPEFLDWPKSDNLMEIWRALRTWKSKYNIKTAILERVASMPQQGVKSVFTFGKNFGRWESFLVALGIPHALVTPQKWMKGAGIVKSDGPDPKARVQAVVTRYYPEVEELFGPRGGYKDGRGDALLMAHYWKGENP